MPNRPLTPCRRPGCPALLERPGYCPDHRPDAAPERAAFAALDRAKTDESKAFYASRRWTAASKRHREFEPLCRRCRAKGRVVPAEMVHHNPPVEALLALGLSPYDDRYLESLCNNCHLEELRAKRGPPRKKD
ncbi:hypothetical protein R80B4_00982 [Fibrobacteres bacterium R8-0-B4]